MVEIWGFGGPFVGVGDGNPESGRGSGSRRHRGTGDGRGNNELCGVHDDGSHARLEKAQTQALPRDAEARSVDGGGEGTVGVCGVEERGGVKVGDAGEEGKGQEVDGTEDS